MVGAGGRRVQQPEAVAEQPDVEAAEAAIQSEVTNRLAAAGIDPIARAAASEAPQEMTRAEFKKLSAKAKAEFCSNGGVIL